MRKERDVSVPSWAGPSEFHRARTDSSIPGIGEEGQHEKDQHRARLWG